MLGEFRPELNFLLHLTSLFADGTPNDLEKAAFERVGPVEEKLKKYGTYTIKYTDDFVVQ